MKHFQIDARSILSLNLNEQLMIKVHKMHNVTNSNKCSLFFNFQVSTIDLQALTCLGPTRENLVYRPQAALELDKQLFMNDS